MIPIKPLARVLTQVIWIASGTIIRATLKAYRESVAQSGIAAPSLARQKMSPEEAARILGFTSHKGIAMEEIARAHERLRRNNMASNNFAGSPYLVERIDAAGYILSEELGKVPPSGK
ncbi:hypothetical protein BgAZ_402680 [Babesia gibsoni]|uniref:Uncharacterized protein n=1 Tax=Babesia gibsoni TaxID=33632 RepID=A0AAD8LMP6_BABGI|nr:hypothetical protein BgAZ_402680 [Babesia gibsoni]